TILIASRISTVSSLDKIIVLKDGKLEAFGSHEELMKTSPTYTAMAMLQELEKEKGGM
ncbi:MAG: ABC transporter ATP-binding protein, partial [Bacilli bacterium]|nr:ABC transporter ATP-binding protein [Bacilli bacterium]